MDWMLWVILGLAALAVFGFISLAGDGRKRDDLRVKVLEAAGDGLVLVKKPQLGEPVALALRDNAFFLAQGETILELPASALIEASVETDGATVTKVSRASQLGGAAIGAVVAGPAGAIIGGLSGKTTSTAAAPKDVRLRLITESEQVPLIDIPFIEAVSTGVTNGHLAQREADEWLARIKGFIRRASASV